MTMERGIGEGQTIEYKDEEFLVMPSVVFGVLGRD